MASALIAGTAFLLSLMVGWLGRPVAATRVLTTRHPALPVWLGVTGALVAQSAIAVLVGSQLARVPRQPVVLATVGLFAVTAILLPRGARHADTAEAERERFYADRIVGGQRGHRAALASFALLVTAAEWGSPVQVLTVGLVACGGPAVPVLVGSGLALAAVAAAAAFGGGWLLHRVRLTLVHHLAALACAVLAVLTALGVPGREGG